MSKVLFVVIVATSAVVGGWLGLQLRPHRAPAAAPKVATLELPPLPKREIEVDFGTLAPIYASAVPTGPGVPANLATVPWIGAGGSPSQNTVTLPPPWTVTQGNQIFPYLPPDHKICYLYDWTQNCVYFSVWYN